MNYPFAQRFDGISGSEIRKIFALLKEPGMISFAGGNPSPALFPAKIFAEISEELLLKHGAGILQYGGTMGLTSLINLLKEEKKDVMKETDDLIILTGSSQGIDFFARSFLERGDCVLTESPTFLGALQTFRLSDARVYSAKLLDDGVDLADLEEKIVRCRPKFYYTIPTFQNPTGITSDAEKRAAVYEICKKHGVLILEDDPYKELRYEGEPIFSIKSLDDAGIVCRLYSFSKTISPGMRVGYAIADQSVIEKFNFLKQGADVHTSNLTQAMICEFLKRGLYEDHVRELIRDYSVQRDAMCGAIDLHFPDWVRRTDPKGGFFVWCRLPEGFDARILFERCVKKNVAFVCGSSFFADGGHQNTLRLNFSMPSVEQIEKGIRVIGEQLKEMAEE